MKQLYSLAYNLINTHGECPPNILAYNLVLEILLSNSKLLINYYLYSSDIITCTLIIIIYFLILSLSWSDEISLCADALMSLTMDHKGESVILIVSITKISSSLIKVYVRFYFYKTNILYLLLLLCCVFR